MPEAAGSPYIKPEPKSPSPMTAPAFGRAPKRQKLPHQDPQEVSYDRPRYDGPRYAEPRLDDSRYDQGTNGSNNDHERYAPRTYRDERAAATVYERPDYSYYSRIVDEPVIVREVPRRDQELHDDRHRATSSQYGGHPQQSPTPYPVQYAPREPQPARPVLHAAVEGPSRAGYPVAVHTAHREVYEAPRINLRPGIDRDHSRSPGMRARTPAMGPPTRIQEPSRIIVDEFGREYIEPPRPPTTAIRPSAAPPSRPSEREIIYQRAPPPVRAASRLPDTFEEGGIIYRRASPAYAAPRRVVTPAGLRGPRPPRLPTQRVRAADRRRPSPPRITSRCGRGRSGGSWTSAPASTCSERPARGLRSRSATKWQRPRAYGGERLGSVRPEMPVREYGAQAVSVRHPDVRREYAAAAGSAFSEVARREMVAQPLGTEYGVRSDADMAHRAYNVRPVEPPSSIYGRPLPLGDDVTYVDRPRGGEPDLVYSNPPHRDVYR